MNRTQYFKDLIKIFGFKKETYCSPKVVLLPWEIYIMGILIGTNLPEFFKEVIDDIFAQHEKASARQQRHQHHRLSEHEQEIDHLIRQAEKQRLRELKIQDEKIRMQCKLDKENALEQCKHEL